MENDKEESVYVLAAPDGTPNEITVNVALKNKGLDQKLTDETFLTGLKNKEGDEEVTDLGDEMCIRDSLQGFQAKILDFMKRVD